MARMQWGVIAMLFILGIVLPANSQQTTNVDSAVVVPLLVNFSGTLASESGKPVTGLAGVTFSLYRESEGGSPLWMETQNIRVDKTGHYSATLGSASAHGIPA